jgi:hypothetical protein
MDHTRIDESWVLARFETIYPVHRLGLARLLVVLRQDFGGDLDAMLVLLSVSLGVISNDWPAALFDEVPESRNARLTNTQSIADTTGIPRESVRRKLAAMRAKGWVRRNESGNWEPTRQAAADLRAGSAATVTFIADLVATAVAARPRDGMPDPPPVA